MAYTICPQCGGDHLLVEIPQMGQIYHCMDCNYRGSFILEADTAEEAQQLAKAVRESTHEDPSR